MKFMIKIIILVSCSLLLWECSTDMMEYEGKSGVYFMMQKKPVSGFGDPEVYEYTDTTYISFASIIGVDTVLPVRVRILGNVSDRDRYFSLEIDEQATTAKSGEDYDAFELNQCIKANERQAEIPVRILETPKLYQHPDTVIYLCLHLRESADFTLPLPWWSPFGNMYGDSKDSINILRHVIAINEVLPKPNYWPEQYWGTFSGKKFSLMCTLFEMTWEDFSKLNVATDRTRALIMGQNLDRYLKEKEKNNETIYEDARDENGDLVKMTAGWQI